MHAALCVQSRRRPGGEGASDTDCFAQLNFLRRLSSRTLQVYNTRTSLDPRSTRVTLYTPLTRLDGAGSRRHLLRERLQALRLLLHDDDAPAERPHRACDVGVLARDLRVACAAAVDDRFGVTCSCTAWSCERSRSSSTASTFCCAVLRSASTESWVACSVTCQYSRHALTRRVKTSSCRGGAAVEAVPAPLGGAAVLGGGAANENWRSTSYAAVILRKSAAAFGCLLTSGWTIVAFLRYAARTVPLADGSVTSKSRAAALRLSGKFVVSDRAEPHERR